MSAGLFSAFLAVIFWILYVCKPHDTLTLVTAVVFTLLSLIFTLLARHHDAS